MTGTQKLDADEERGKKVFETYMVRRILERDSCNKRVAHVVAKTLEICWEQEL